MPRERPSNTKGVAAALDAVVRERKARRPKCFTCREPRWVAFVREGLELGYAMTDIYRALREPTRYGLDFPPFPHTFGTLSNHINFGHGDD